METNALVELKGLTIFSTKPVGCCTRLPSIFSDFWTLTRANLEGKMTQQNFAPSSKKIFSTMQLNPFEFTFYFFATSDHIRAKISCTCFSAFVQLLLSAVGVCRPLWHFGRGRLWRHSCKSDPQRRRHTHFHLPPSCSQMQRDRSCPAHKNLGGSSTSEWSSCEVTSATWIKRNQKRSKVTPSRRYIKD